MDDVRGTIAGDMDDIDGENDSLSRRQNYGRIGPDFRGGGQSYMPDTAIGPDFRGGGQSYMSNTAIGPDFRGGGQSYIADTAQSANSSGVTRVYDDARLLGTNGVNGGSVVAIGYSSTGRNGLVAPICNTAADYIDGVRRNSETDADYDEDIIVSNDDGGISEGRLHHQQQAATSSTTQPSGTNNNERLQSRTSVVGSSQIVLSKQENGSAQGGMVPYACG